mgnify:CR=1 FL=1
MTNDTNDTVNNTTEAIITMDGTPREMTPEEIRQEEYEKLVMQDRAALARQVQIEKDHFKTMSERKDRVILETRESLKKWEDKDLGDHILEAIKEMVIQEVSEAFSDLDAGDLQIECEHVNGLDYRIEETAGEAVNEQVREIDVTDIASFDDAVNDLITDKLENLEIETRVNVR